MEIKKSTKASVEGKKTLFFLVGLNLVLLGVWMLFNVNSQVKVDAAEHVEIVAPDAAPNIVMDYSKPEVPENQRVAEPELPDPVIDLTDIEETPDPVENIPDIRNADKPKVPDYIRPPANTGTIRSLGELQAAADKLVDEKILEPVSPLVVHKMAVYPGCEKMSVKTELLNCFSEKLSQDMLKYLDKDYPNTNKEMLKVQLRFKVDTEGEITDIEPVGDKEFQLQAKRALEKVNENLKKTGKRIEPARMTDDSKAILKFQSNVVLEKP